MRRYSTLILYLSTLLWSSVITAFEFPHIVDEHDVKLEIFPRAPEQIASFYEARGFPKEMIEVLKQECFITIRIHNRRDDILWLDLTNWTLRDDQDEIIERDHRDIWKRRWQAMDIPMPSQSTFRWTLLPETLDYLPDEQESGNLIIPRVSGNIDLTARFATGENKEGEMIELRYDRFHCAEDKR